MEGLTRCIHINAYIHTQALHTYYKRSRHVLVIICFKGAGPQGRTVDLRALKQG
jgi:hypothetical protein